MRAHKPPQDARRRENALLLLTEALSVVASVGIVCGGLVYLKYCLDDDQTQRQIAELQEQRRQAIQAAYEASLEEGRARAAGRGSDDAAAVEADADDAAAEEDAQEEDAQEGVSEPQMLPEYAQLYALNPDIVGWLTIDGTRIDYPVMQTVEDEDYYIHRDFMGNYNTNGCLFVAAADGVGIGTAADGYAEGESPSTNILIHGHHMASLEMFGALNYYRDQSYAQAHPVICFDTLYERREYQVMAAFYSQVYYRDQNVFKYYQFSEARDETEFDYYYDNIRRLSLYDLGVTATYGDEFITLSTCEYHVDNGRFVVVGKRVR